MTMSDIAPAVDRPPAVDRIERAVARIEAATTARAAAGRALAERHAALRERMAEAVAALDVVIAGAEAD